MLDVINKKVKQMHLALDNLTNPDLTDIEPHSGRIKTGFYYGVDFNQGKSEAELANTASLLIANIASIKDHLKAWCKRENKQFEGETFIDSNIDVAIIHDLWNIDKHAELNRKPRSGKLPKLKNLVQRLNATGGSVVFRIDPETGKMISETTGNVSLSIDAEVVDEHGNKIGDFAAICENATAAWENELISAGIPIAT